jgi:hypothetical protein
MNSRRCIGDRPAGMGEPIAIGDALERATSRGAAGLMVEPRGRLLRCISRVLMLGTAPPPAHECHRCGAVIDADLTKRVFEVGSVAHQAAAFDTLAIPINCRNPVARRQGVIGRHLSALALCKAASASVLILDLREVIGQCAQSARRRSLDRFINTFIINCKSRPK